jgi:multidrug resistance efflux pump
LIVPAGMAIVAVIWRVDTAPRTDDAYAYADTIGVSPEVSGKIVMLAVHDNQAVKQGDLLFEVDPRPYQYALERAEASLAQLNAQILLTQRSVNAQVFSAAAAKSAVARAQVTEKQAADTLARMEPLIGKGYVSADDLDRARTAQRSAQAGLEAAQSQEREAQAAISSVDALIAQYDQTVLDAVRDVAQGGGAIDDLDQRVQLQHQRIDALQFASDSADASYRTGLADRATALQAKEPLFEGRLALVELSGDEIEAGIALTEALGGGYRDDDLPSAQAEVPVAKVR